MSNALVLSKHHDITIVEIDEKKIQLINSGIAPFSEDGMEPLLQDALDRGSIRVVNNDAELGFQDAVFICVNTPSDDDGSVDLKSVESVVDFIESKMDSFLDNHLLIVMRSTVPPGTTKSIVIDRLSTSSSMKNLGFIFQPEFLRQGVAIHDLQEPDRIIIGASSNDAYRKYCEIILPCIKKQDILILQMSIDSAELCKYVSNSFLATKVSFINEISRLAEILPNVNIDDVVLGMTADHRICSSHLRPGLGFGGSCLPKDVHGLISFAESKGLHMQLLHSVQDINSNMTERVLGFLDKPNLKGKKVAILGMAFKANTDDCRSSPTLLLIRRLSSIGAIVYVHDPSVNLERTREHLALTFEIASEVSQCTKDAYVTFLMTDWNEYFNLGLELITQEMSVKMVIDGRRMFVNSQIPDGVIYRSLGTYQE